MGARLRVAHWEKYQHYKNRNPPWIKLHVALLENPEFACLQDASKMHLIGIWLLASRLDNDIPADATFIGHRINATEPVDIKSLIELGFLEVASGSLDGCLQDASEMLAQSREEERRDRGETETDTSSGLDLSVPDRALRLFMLYREILGKTDRMVFDSKRKRAVNGRIKEGRTDEEFEAAFRGCAGSEFHRNGNHTDIELICRDAKHFERFVEMHKNPSKSEKDRGDDAARAWVTGGLGNG